MKNRSHSPHSPHSPHSINRLFDHSIIPHSHSPTRRGFTIVELLVVIAIIGVLIGLVSVAVTASVRNGRTKRAEAMCSVLQQAIAMYYTKTGDWPKAIQAKADGSSDDSDTVVLQPSDADEVFQEIVKKSTGSGATLSLIDASALFVADKNRLRKNGEGCYDNHGDASCSQTYCGNQGCVSGIDFSSASRSGKSHIALDSMAFGYQATHSGKFSRFWIIYNRRTDSVSVSRKDPKKAYPQDWN